jgi:hypothetical protein
MNNKLIEGEDFYYEEVDGIKYRVFTEAYQAKRGFCCNNSCKNCPFNKKGNDEKK